MNSLDLTDINAEGAHSNLDAGVVEEICQLLTGKNPKSFFLFAGAGSGKTRTLIEVLTRLTGLQKDHEAGMRFAEQLREGARRIAVITYTNNAVNEINARLGLNPLVSVSTIHSFAWLLIQGFDQDIREILKQTKKQLIEETQQKSRDEEEANKRRTKAPTKSSLEKLAKWQSELAEWKEELNILADVSHFTYTPDKLTFGPGALNHSQVVQLAAELLRRRPTLARILSDRHPVILIDESQDTMRDLLNTLIEVEQSSQGALHLGLIGDHRQRIYLDGHKDLPSIIPPDWARPMLQMNHRSRARIVKLINRIWHAELKGRTQQASGGRQVPRSDRADGIVRVFVGNALESDKPGLERRCAERMGSISGLDGWSSSPGGYKILLLEHKLSARRGGFLALAEALEMIDRDATYKSNATEGDIAEDIASWGGISELRLFRLQLYRLKGTLRSDGTADEYQIMELVSRWSRLMSPQYLAKMSEEQQPLHLRKVREHIQSLLDCWKSDADPHLYELVRLVGKSHLFELQEGLQDWFQRDSKGELGNLDPKQDKKLYGLHQALQCQWSMLMAYFDYLDERTAYGTHQGVKGSQFEHVMVVLDDEDAGGTLFSYDKLFGVRALSDTDQKNVQEAKETSIDRTLRLFYVTCSRPKESLAIVYWSRDPKAAAEAIKAGDWFQPDEVILL